MKVSFFGACREVTGSCIFIESQNVKFLVDCGMFQGSNSYEKNFKDFLFNPKEIDFVLLTHAHLDHLGRLPKLYKEGFRGKVFSTRATKDLSEIILKDSVRIFQKDERPALFDLSDVLGLMNLFECFDYLDEIKSKGISIKLKDAGHILGSAIFEVFTDGKKIVFSGDLGNENAPIVKDTAEIDSADVLFIESTYGGKIHSKREEGVKKLFSLIEEIIERQGVLLIPSFSIERTQEILFEINRFVESERIPFMNIFLDSPLAIKATQIYESFEELYDKESITLINSGDDIFDFDGFKKTMRARDSKKIIKSSCPKIIIAGSGMCSGGRMPFYIKKYGKDSKNIILLNSYQAEGTVGKKLENKQRVFINDKEVIVKARVEKIKSFSSHADALKLKKWALSMNPKKVFIVHGEEEQSLALQENLKEELESVIVPEVAKNYFF